MKTQATHEQTQASQVGGRGGDVVLRDGSTVHVRPIRSDDEARLAELFKSLSEQSRWLRFFSPAKDQFLTAEAHREANVDKLNGFALVATSGLDEKLVGQAFYSRTAEDRAEVAFAISDAYQGRGLGTILLGQLASVAAENGIEVFEAEVLSANHNMSGVFRQSGFPTEVSAAAGQLHFTFPTSLTSEAIERFENRERTASENALKLFFQPRAIAVIGASRQRGTIGGEVFHNLLDYGFVGPVYPVNPAAD
ncbi:MAG TPA: GNAT family N-acetyltransferase, partial [Blastocatellia bacterium]|nr:GNAT family N-acetyltransferase [Blastocatellia bacterium]